MFHYLSRMGATYKAFLRMQIADYSDVLFSIVQASSYISYRHYMKLPRTDHCQPGMLRVFPLCVVRAHNLLSLSVVQSILGL